MASEVTQLVTLEAQQFRETQISKWGFLYTLNVAVPNNSTFPAQLPIEEDAEFFCHSFTGSCYGPTNSLGVKALNASTDFPLAGTAVPSGAGLPAIADRGLMFNITDQGAGRTLANGFIAAETILSPGYGLSRSIPQPFRYWGLRNSKLQFDIRNRDTALGAGDTTLYHYLSLTIYGFKYNVPKLTA